MLIRLIFSISLFIVWGFICWKWYVCGIKQACPEPIPEVVITDDRPIVYEWGNPQAITRSSFPTYRDTSILASLKEGDILEIIGLYTTDEPTTAGFINLGEARASAIKDTLSAFLSTERLLVAHREIPNKSALKDSLFEAVLFNVIDASAVESVEITELEDRTIIQFPFGKADKDLEPEADSWFSRFVSRLKNKVEKVHITGHTDDVGNEQKNQQLGLARAVYIQNILIKKGLAKDRIIIDSKGETEPIADNSSEAGQRRNRRVEIRLE